MVVIISSIKIARSPICHFDMDILHYLVREIISIIPSIGHHPVILMEIKK